MPSLIEGESREAVKRAIPKSSNKIHAGAIARLYIAYPDRHRWTYTGLQGAVMLSNDLVGHTFWLKMVDISGSNRGVIWDQEIYDIFQYNQDRVFFHTFELEKCMAGLSFVDDKEAKTFKKKMDEREKNAHRKTRERPFGAAAGRQEEAQGAGKSHSLLGGLGGKLFGHRSSSATHQPQPQSIIPPTDMSTPPPSSPLPAQAPQNDDILATLDPSLLKELKDLGLDEDQIKGNAGFIRDYVEQRRQDSLVDNNRGKAPAPPQPLTPQDTGNTSSSRRGPAPAPPPTRRGGGTARPPSPPPDSDEAEPSPRAHHSTFKVPVFSGAGKFASDAASSSPNRSRADSGATPAPGPPPPPRPPKTPLEDDNNPQVFGVPPPFAGSRKPVPPARGTVPPPPPTRNTGPPSPPARETSTVHSIPPAAIAPPPLPPKTPNALESPMPNRSLPPPPPPPTREDNTRSVPPPPPAPAQISSRPSIAVPAPPPPPAQPSLPSRNGPPMPPAPPPMPSNSGAAPPPPPPPPAPSLPPGMEPVTANAPSIPSGGGDRGGLLADIRGGARLKKVSEKEKNDRSAAPVPGASSGGGAASGGSAAPSGGDAGLAGALANALAKRKEKVAHSDDEDDKDDW